MTDVKSRNSLQIIWTKSYQDSFNKQNLGQNVDYGAHDTRGRFLLPLISK